LNKQKELNDAADELRQMRSTAQNESKGEDSTGPNMADLQAKFDSLAKEKELLEAKLSSIAELNQQLLHQREESDSLLEEAKKKISDLEEGYGLHSYVLCAWLIGEKVGSTRRIKERSWKEFIV